MRKKGIRVDVDADVLDAFVSDKYGTYRQLSEETGLSERTIRRARQNGFISLETAVDMCLAVDGTFEDVFGRQGDWMRTVISLGRGSG